MTVIPFPGRRPTPSIEDPGATCAALDIIRERHEMAASSRAPDDDELAVSSVETIYASATMADLRARRQMMVRAGALVIAEVERIERLIASSNPPPMGTAS
ncbi:hypothetical protein [Beijerinckia sp. L45]|uniref:hypothetical protein n=1 Tax=Beijerinckia sp. L45 TaxID=1641855 RepID=UPI00131D7100|nr:hypothetical protein [Beijerinckia sp. L45]